MQELTPINTALIAFIAWFSYMGFRQRAWFERYLFDTAQITYRRQYIRILSSAFLHANWTHFFFNAFSLLLFGSLLEAQRNAIFLLLIFLGSVVGGSLFSLRLQRGKSYTAVGASGGASGVMLSAASLYPTGLEIWFIPAWIFSLIYLGASVYALERNNDNIGHDAHIGGAIVGILLTALLEPRVLTQNPLQFTTLLFASIGLLLYLLQRSGGIRRPRRQRQRTQSKRTTPPKPSQQHRVDQLLDKISREGINSLTPAERAFLRRQSDNRNKPR